MCIKCDGQSKGIRTETLRGGVEEEEGVEEKEQEEEKLERAEEDEEEKE